MADENQPQPQVKNVIFGIKIEKNLTHAVMPDVNLTLDDLNKIIPEVLDWVDYLREKRRRMKQGVAI